MVNLPDSILANHDPRYVKFDGFYGANGSLKEHLCVILHKDITAKKIYYIYITSQEQNSKTFMRKNLEALVEISETEMSPFFANPKKSFITCSKSTIQDMSFLEFNKTIDRIGRNSNPIIFSNSIKNRIIDGIRKSKTIDQEFIQLVIA